MRFIIAVLLSFSAFTATGTSQITCNNFELTAGIAGEQIVISLSTDLPADSRVFFEVSRRYWRKGKSGSYTLDYYATEHAVSETSSGLKIDVSERAVNKALERLNAQAEFAGRSPIEITELAPSFKVKATISMVQPDPKFGPYNKKLEGAAIRQIDEYRGCKRIIHVESTAQAEARKKAEAKPNMVKPRDFEVGKVYALRSGLTLVSHPDDLEGLAPSLSMTMLPDTSLVYIDRREERDGVLWFRLASAAALDLDPMTSGWAKVSDFDIKKHREVQAPIMVEKLEATGFISEGLEAKRWRLVGTVTEVPDFQRKRVLRGVIELEDGLERAEAESQARAAAWEILEMGKAVAVILALRRAGDSIADAGEVWILPRSFAVPEAMTPKALLNQATKPQHTHAKLNESYFKKRPKVHAVGTAVYLKVEGSYEVNLWTDPTKIGGESNAKIAADSYGKIIGFRYVDEKGVTVIRYEVEDENGRKGWVSAEVVTPA